MIRIGAVAYLNARPLVWGLEHGLGAGRVELSQSVPARLAERMAAGELDVALLPVVELARLPQLELVPGLGIVSRGPGRSVLLVARRPLAEIRSVALDPESRTTNALVRLLFAAAWRQAPRFVPGPRALETALDEHDAAVRIGDKALFEPLPPGTHALDLGAAWTSHTGLPFVYAAWVARPGVVDEELYRLLHASCREGLRALPRIAAGFSWNGRRDPALAQVYLSENIVYRLGAPELQALELFFRTAHEHGIVERVTPLALAPRRSTGRHETAVERELIPTPAEGRR